MGLLESYRTRSTVCFCPTNTGWLSYANASKISHLYVIGSQALGAIDTNRTGPGLNQGYKAIFINSFSRNK